MSSSASTTIKSLSNKYRSSSSSSSSSSSVVVPILPFETLSHQSASVRLDNHRHRHQSQHQQDHEQQEVVPECDKQFLLQLQSSLDYWKENKYKSVWLHIPTSRASLIESLQQQDEDDDDNNNKNNDDDDDDDDDVVSTNANSTGKDNTNTLAFDLHHVNTVENTIVLKKWLRPLSEGEDKIPPFATHQVGCAGFVLSDNNELLLVKERRTSTTTTSTGDDGSSTRTTRQPSTWKLPGGLLDVGETFGEAACRETLEETGVHCDFQSVLAFWHRHHGLPMFEGIKSDLYYVCLLAPKTDTNNTSHKGNNNTIHIDPVEISEATWMPVQEYLDTENHPLINHVLKYVYHLDKDDLTSKSKFHSLSSDTQHYQTDTNTNTNTNTNRNGRTRLEPVVEMIEGHVTFGPPDHRRPSFLTYTGRHGDNKQS